MGKRGEVFSTKISNDKRTYFFNVKENRFGDLFINIVESKKNAMDGFERQSVIIFEEDLNDFVKEFQKAVDFVKKKS
ncbi:MAG: DUF3276 family protein [Spirochaetia bacterium]|jgi:glycerol kinase|nr:DUF3276 family protein [Spirochaetia bacterium]